MAGSLVKKLSYKVCFCPTQESSCIEAGWSACWGYGHTLLSTSSHLVYTTLQSWGRVNAGAISVLIKQQKISSNVN